MAKKKTGKKAVPCIEAGTIYERKGDYNHKLKLAVSIDCLGDVTIGIVDPTNRKEPIRTVRFATLAGGGKSINVLHALSDLILAIQRDIKENPEHK